MESIQTLCIKEQLVEKQKVEKGMVA